jgi:hypothetical protein
MVKNDSSVGREGRLEHLRRFVLRFGKNKATKNQLFTAICTKKLGLSARNRYPMQLFFCISSR